LKKNLPKKYFLCNFIYKKYFIICKNNLKEKTRTFIPKFFLVIIVIINLLFVKLPLLNTLHYEISAVNAIVLSLLGGYITLFYFGKNKEYKNLFYEKKSYFRYLFLYVTLPFVISFTSTVLCQKCTVTEGIKFYLIIAAPGVLIGSTIAFFSMFVTKRYTFLFFTGLWILLTLGFLPELYFNPQIYFYNPVFAYFPGVMYDLNIEISQTLVLYRSLNIIFSVCLIIILILKYNSSKTSKLIIITTVIIINLMFGIVKNNLGFSTTTTKIENNLKGYLETEHFKIIYPQKISDNEKKILILNHEFYYGKIKKILNSEPDKKITSFLFTTGARKKELFGSGNADVAKVWLNQIYLNYDNYNNSLKHEIAHIFSGKFAKGIFKFPANYNPALLEGFAMAIENNYDDFDIDYLAFLAYKNNYKISLQKLFSNFSFFTNTTSLSYIFAGSFIKYLSDKYGWKKTKQLYSVGDFKKVYHKSIGTLGKEYYNYLNKLNFTNNKNRAKLYFGHLPLIKKICAHAVAKQTKNAWLLFRKKHYSNAEKKFEEIYKYSNTYSSLVGIIKTKIELKKYEEAKKILLDKIKRYTESGYYYSLENMLGNIYCLLNEYTEATKVFENIKRKKVRFNYTNTAEIKLFLIKNYKEKLKQYIGNNTQKKKILKELLISKPSDAVLQTITEEKFSLEEYRNTLKNILIETTAKHKYFSDTYFRLSKFALKFSDFNNAKRYAEISLQNVKQKRKKIVQELIKKTDWESKNKSSLIN